MRYTIDEEILEKYNLTLDEFLVLILNSRQSSYKEIKESLINKGVVDINLYDDELLVLSNNTKDLITGILVDSDKRVINKDSEYEALAIKLKEVYPSGKKPGTSYPWRDSTAVIARKLKTITTQFNCTFTEEDAIKATEEYVKSFNGDYRYMELLKYFILRTDKSTGEIKSNFMSFLENIGQEDSINNDWEVTLK